MVSYLCRRQLVQPLRFVHQPCAVAGQTWLQPCVRRVSCFSPPPSIVRIPILYHTRVCAGKATLRLKIDMTSDNPTLWDPVAYRIKYTPHPHTGS